MTNEFFYKRLEGKYSKAIEDCNQTATLSSDYHDTCEIQKGFYEVTGLGKSFISACKK